MTITTPCRQCRQPVSIMLDDSTPDAEAEALASRLYCIHCAIERTTQHTASHEASQGRAGGPKPFTGTLQKASHPLGV